MVDFISSFIALIVVILFLSSFFNAYVDPNKHFTLFEYFTDFDKEIPKKTEVTFKKEIVTQKRSVKKETKKEEEKSNNNINEEIAQRLSELRALKEDCNLAMKSIGVDAKQRKYLIQKVFERDRPKSVEEFIRIAFA
jgi:hypothetical protein